MHPDDGPEGRAIGERSQELHTGVGSIVCDGFDGSELGVLASGRTEGGFSHPPLAFEKGHGIALDPTPAAGATVRDAFHGKRPTTVTGGAERNLEYSTGAVLEYPAESVSLDTP